MKSILNKWAVFLLTSVVIIGCGAAPDQDPQKNQRARVVENYADMVYANYTDALRTARLLQTAVNGLTTDPSEATLAAARAAWKQARIPYGQTEVFRFYNGPIDNEENGPEGLLNAWPMDEAYVDYVEGAPNAGIIQDAVTYPVIDKGLLETLNEKNGETNISTGYHAIEFLLWGQDLSDDSAGKRSYTDYTTAPHADRRGQYLTAVTELLMDHLQILVDAWEPGQTDNYRAQFLAQPSADALQAILAGMVELSGHELSGERMMVAYETKAQEDEHSCFSDNTHVDIIENARGIQNVYLGRYLTSEGKEVSGTALMDLVAVKNPALAQKMNLQLQEMMQAVTAIPVPFDQAILGSDTSEGRVKVKAAIDSLRSQVNSMQEILDMLDVK